MKKKNLSLYLLLLMTSTIIAQKKDTLIVTYSITTFWEIDSTKYNFEQRKALEDAMNEKRYFKLTTNSQESIYQAIPKIDNNPKDGFSVSFSSSENYLYKNFNDSILILEESFPKKYTVKDSLINFKWIISDENSRILNYNIRKAQSFHNNYRINAWYTEDIPYKDGPKDFWGLPGLILIVEVTRPKNNEKTQIVVEKIEKTQKKTTIKPKFNNKKMIHREEYNAILNDFIKKENEMLGIGVDTE